MAMRKTNFTHLVIYDFGLIEVSSAFVSIEQEIFESII